MSKCEYDEKRDRFYLTLFDGDTEYAFTPESLEDLYDKIGKAAYIRRELLDVKR